MYLIEVVHGMVVWFGHVARFCGKGYERSGFIAH
jgi:hypothetical protein